MLRSVKIVQVGRDKFEYIKLGKEDYYNRLNRYFSVEEVIIKENRANDKIKRLKEESLEIKKHIRKDSTIIVLSPEGVQMDSVEFSKFIYRFSSITFIIGGSDGLYEGIKKMGNYIVSFSKMTFPHHIAKIILIEQIYRALAIKNNHKYHK